MPSPRYAIYHTDTIRAGEREPNQQLGQPVRGIEFPLRDTNICAESYQNTLALHTPELRGKYYVFHRCGPPEVVASAAMFL